MSKRKRGGKKSEQASPSFEGWQTLSCDDAGLDADEMSELVSIEVLDGGDEPLLRKFEPEAARQKKGKKGVKAEAKAEAITEAEKVTTQATHRCPRILPVTLHNASTRHTLLSQSTYAETTLPVTVTPRSHRQYRHVVPSSAAHPTVCRAAD